MFVIIGCDFREKDRCYKRGQKGDILGVRTVNIVGDGQITLGGRTGDGMEDWQVILGGTDR